MLIIHLFRCLYLPRATWSPSSTSNNVNKCIHYLYLSLCGVFPFVRLTHSDHLISSWKITVLTKAFSSGHFQLLGTRWRVLTFPHSPLQLQRNSVDEPVPHCSWDSLSSLPRSHAQNFNSPNRKMNWIGINKLISPLLWKLRTSWIFLSWLVIAMKKPIRILSLQPRKCIIWKSFPYWKIKWREKIILETNELTQRYFHYLVTSGNG